MHYCNNCDIVHEEKRCPLCESKEENERLQKEIDDLEDELRNME